MELPDRYPDLAPLTKGASFAQVFDLFYKLAQIRYADLPILKGFNPKIGTKKKIPALAGFGYLGQVNDWFYTADKGLEALKKEGYNVRIIKKNITGKGEQHQRVLSAVISRIMKEPHFYRACYPVFERQRLEPDACLVYKDGDKCRLVFLEVEVSAKPAGYMDNKMRSYEALSKDRTLYSDWWAVWSSKLDLSMGDIKQFCFSVRVENG